MANSTFRAKLADILNWVSWGKIAQHYFGKSSSWLYHKLDEIDGNGRKGEFTANELAQFKGALYDLSDRIRKVADTL